MLLSIIKLHVLVQAAPQTRFLKTYDRPCISLLLSIVPLLFCSLVFINLFKVQRLLCAVRLNDRTSLCGWQAARDGARRGSEQSDGQPSVLHAYGGSGLEDLRARLEPDFSELRIQVDPAQDFAQLMARSSHRLLNSRRPLPGGPPFWR